MRARLSGAFPQAKELEEKDARLKQLEHELAEKAKAKAAAASPPAPEPVETELSTLAAAPSCPLAEVYAVLWNAQQRAGMGVPAHELETAHAELAESGWTVERDAATGKWAAQHEGHTLAVAHAPVGGVMIAGVLFKGGRFIPDAAMDRATPEEKAKLKEAQAASAEGTAKRSAALKAGGLVDTEALQARLQLHKDKWTGGNAKGAAASWRLLMRHHGDAAMHRVLELAGQTEEALARVAEGPKHDWKRAELGKALAKLHGVIDAARANPEGERKKGSPPKKPEKGIDYNVKLEHLKIDPERFQFKQHVNKVGVTDVFKGVKVWDVNRVGVVAVWKDPADGQTYVINGHHRHEMGVRLGAETLPVRYLTDAKDAKMARAEGALINIGEGRGTALDAAKFMRDAGVAPEDLENRGVSLVDRVAADAVVLTKLSDKAFDHVARGTLTEGHAVAVAKHLADHSLQDQLFSLLEKREDEGKIISDKVIEEMAKKMAAASRVTTKEKTLFGDIESEESTFLSAAELQAYVRGELSKEVNDWLAVSSTRRAGRVGGEGSGNVLDLEGNKKIAARAEAAKYTYDTLVNSKGPIADAIDAGAVQLLTAKGRDERNAIKRKTLEAVRDAVLSEDAGSAPAPADTGGTGSGGGGGEGVRAGPAAPAVPADAGRGGAEPGGLKPEAFKVAHGDVVVKPPYEVGGRHQQAFEVQGQVVPSMKALEEEWPLVADEVKKRNSFTGIDAHGHEWKDGKQVTREKEAPAPPPPAEQPLTLFETARRAAIARQQTATDATPSAEAKPAGLKPLPPEEKELNDFGFVLADELHRRGFNQKLDRAGAVMSRDGNRLSITFPNKPPDVVLDRLKRTGFRYLDGRWTANADASEQLRLFARDHFDREQVLPDANLLTPAGQQKAFESWKKKETALAAGKPVPPEAPAPPPPAAKEPVPAEKPSEKTAPGAPPPARTLQDILRDTSTAERQMGRLKPGDSKIAELQARVQELNHERARMRADRPAKASLPPVAPQAAGFDPTKSYAVDGKEPWEMTSREWQDAYDKFRPDTAGGVGHVGPQNDAQNRNRLLAQLERGEKLRAGLPDVVNSDDTTDRRSARHRDVVEAALAAGKNVPAEVLKDYPDLQPKTAPTPPAVKKTAAAQKPSETPPSPAPAPAPVPAASVETPAKVEEPAAPTPEPEEKAAEKPRSRELSDQDKSYREAGRIYGEVVADPDGSSSSMRDLRIARGHLENLVYHEQRRFDKGQTTHEQRDGIIAKILRVEAEHMDRIIRDRVNGKPGPEDLTRAEKISDYERAVADKKNVHAQVARRWASATTNCATSSPMLKST